MLFLPENFNFLGSSPTEASCGLQARLLRTRLGWAAVRAAQPLSHLPLLGTRALAPQSSRRPPARPQSIAIAQPLDGPFIRRYRELARTKGLWLSLGGFQERGPDPSHNFNCHVS